MVIKCITFDKEAQNNLPKEVKDKMKADRKNAEQKLKLDCYWKDGCRKPNICKNECVHNFL